ncbi:CRISPR-associated helicase, Cas3 family [Candidatus Desulfarcum epimagneticum]|uniref:CRISPR-associated helicase, Cas3 family n=1 Tax=uncultured Desulfobacteraceae bacterium TaxID=218296 RepID=A0A484HII1_9BACT|nr:CRISPR-associated helicase, Cas3 family [uncultured Desulfobacteraceae bacterium]
MLIMDICPHIKAKGSPEFTTLYAHLCHVESAIEKFAECLDFDVAIAKKGAVFHDIGKASTVFQKRLVGGYRMGQSTFRHEIASCFFISLISEKDQPALIEMIIAHHKSIEGDKNFKGILDLEEHEGDIFESHIKDWDVWKPDVLKILSAFGIKTRDISRSEAHANYLEVLNYCEKRIEDCGYSRWRGLLMSADHFASALSESTADYLKNTFKNPILDFYSRKSELYPLSLKKATSKKKHTIVVACTGAGKTDYLFRRCKGRVFYTLPFQASINAMYQRVKKDLSPSNPGLDIRILHSASKIAVNDELQEDIALQRLIGSSIKILTPWQLASIVFGTRGFESQIEDIKGCDVILDEIHTYTGVSKSIALKIVEALNYLGCRIHIGTATMPTSLYEQIIALLGEDFIEQVSLDESELKKFDRHRLFKINSWDDSDEIISHAIEKKQKILIVCNRIESAQSVFFRVKNLFPDIPSMLIHSRFKRGDRHEKEKKLLGLDEKGRPTGEFNTSPDACIVVSTQVVEVSLDISFDLMITETAPIDSLIQRFGRVNRKRSPSAIGLHKRVYLIAPPDDEKDCKPYELATLKDSFEVLDHDGILHESDYQRKIDHVFPVISTIDIETHTAFKGDGRWNIEALTHRNDSILVKLLEIESATAIIESDSEAYRNATCEEQALIEIPVKYYSVNDFYQLGCGGYPFVIPDQGYSDEMGLEINKAKEHQTDLSFI